MTRLDTFAAFVSSLFAQVHSVVGDLISSILITIALCATAAMCYVTIKNSIRAKRTASGIVSSMAIFATAFVVFAVASITYDHKVASVFLICAVGLIMCLIVIFSIIGGLKTLVQERIAFVRGGFSDRK